MQWGALRFDDIDVFNFLKERSEICD